MIEFVRKFFTSIARAEAESGASMQSLAPRDRDLLRGQPRLRLLALLAAGGLGVAAWSASVGIR